MKQILLLALLIYLIQFSFAQSPNLNVNWDKQVMVSKSVATLQVVVTPKIRNSSPIYKQAFDALRNLKADYVRYAAWYPYPRLSVAELEPPDNKRTYWDFSIIDPMTLDFLNATKGYTTVLNLSTIPQWMFKTDKPVTYPKDPDEIAFNYGGGNQLRDTTLKELGDFYARLISWYTKGGFTDELGKYHQSGHNFSLPYYEILNEPELEHGTTPEQYTKRYDAIVSAIRKVSPDTKFVGMAAVTYWDPKFFEYFLNPANHKAGTPIDAISYHFYAGATPGQTIEDYQFSYFDKTDNFLNCVRYIENIRKRLNPNVKTHLNELGTFLTDEMRNGQPIPAFYWNLSASVFAYLYIELLKLGIDVIGESQLLGYPGQFPDVSMMNWENGKPNARYWALKLIKDNFSPGDTLVETNAFLMTPSDYVAQSFNTKSGKKILLLNKRNKTLNIQVPENFKGAKMYSVDLTSGENEPVQSDITSNTIEVKPFAVIVVSVMK